MAPIGRRWLLWGGAAAALMVGMLAGVQLMLSDAADERHDFDFSVPRKSVANFVVTVPTEQRDSFLQVMRKLALANNLKMRTGRVAPDRDTLFVDLWGKDMMLTGGNVFDATDFHFHLYVDEKSGGTRSRAEQLVRDLKRSMLSGLGIVVQDER